jgi:hypothetical protein
MSVNPNNFDPNSVITTAETKFCTLPGQEPITLSTEYGGHGCRIGDTPRTVPLFFHHEAVAKGAYTEEQIADLKARLSGVETPGALSTQVDPSNPPLTLLQDSDNDGFAPPPPNPAPPAATSEKIEQIKAAIIDLLNTGNPSDFTSTGTPKVEALKEKLGFEVTGPERDAAYEAAKG